MKRRGVVTTISRKFLGRVGTPERCNSNKPTGGDMNKAWQVIGLAGLVGLAVNAYADVQNIR
ncbi:MAG: hypothetical protein NZ483_11680, partial [Verrucomicrobiae bacterium]|nr:hypothetical protein [Verrucomicrobiae bacterium]